MNTWYFAAPHLHTSTYQKNFKVTLIKTRTSKVFLCSKCTTTDTRGY